MARIRTIKPEFWDSPDTAKASLRARLLYISMWNLADDYGIGDGNFKRIVGFGFPNDEIGVADLPRLVAEVSRTFSVMFFESAGRTYYWIPSWENHQRTEKRAKQRVPFPDNPKTLTSSGEIDSGGFSEEFRGNTVLGTGEQGNRGTGEVLKTCPTPSHESESENQSDPKSDKTDFTEWWAAYPRKDSKGPARTAYEKAKKKAGSKTLLTGAERYRDDPNREQQFTKHPASWLNAECWEDGPLPPRANTRPAQGHSERGLAKGLQMLEAYDASQAAAAEIEA